MYLLWYIGKVKDDPDLILKVVFYRTKAGAEPVRDWLKALPLDARKLIGADIKTVQFGWPVGMPLVRKLDSQLWEVRSKIREGIARVVFTVVRTTMVLLHGFVKKSQKTPARELATAQNRAKRVRGEGKK